MCKFHSAEFLFKLGIFAAFFPFLIKRFLVLGSEDYLYWISVDYISRGVSLLGLVLIACCRSPLLTPPERAGVGRSFEIFLMMFVATVFIEAVAVPAFSLHIRILELSHFPRIENPTLRWLDLNLGLILVAVSEELVFRWVMLNVIKNHSKNTTLAVLISSIAFGLVHWSSGLTMIIAAFLIGLVFAITYLRSGRILLCITTHYFIDRFGPFLRGGELG